MVDHLKDHLFLYLFKASPTSGSEEKDELTEIVQTMSPEAEEELQQLIYHVHQPYSGVPVKNRRYRLKIYKQCFIGREMVDWLCNYLRIERNVAVKLGLILQQKYSLFDHVTNDHDFKDGYFFYRFVTKKRLVVVGGGFAGSLVCKKLQTMYNVTLIDNKPNFENTLSFPGLVATGPEGLTTISTAHTKYLKKTNVVVDEVVDIAASSSSFYTARGSIKAGTTATPTSIPCSIAKIFKKGESSTNVTATTKTSPQESSASEEGEESEETLEDEPSLAVSNEEIDSDDDEETEKQYAGIVKTAKGQAIPYDYLVLCTGSSFSVSFPVEGENVIVNPYKADSLLHRYNVLKQASKITVIGGGPVGCEYAGELAAAFPDKKITLVSQRTLLERLVPSAHKNAYSTFSKYKNINMILGKRVASISNNRVKLLHVAKTPTVDDSTELDELDDDEVLEKRAKVAETQEKAEFVDSDIIFLCVGYAPNTKMLKNCMNYSINPQGFVQVNEYFQVALTESKTHFHEHVFAIGDITDIREEKLAQSAEKHASNVADILKKIAVSAPKKEWPVYKPPKSYFQIISLGPNKAIMVNGSKVLAEGAFMMKIKYMIEMKSQRG